MSVLPPTDESLRRAAEALQRGGLVAIPTETVYGLGGNALDSAAVASIYRVKGRPATDPLICHVDSVTRAMALWDPEADAEALALAQCLGTALWPGPLTIVCKAHPSLPSCVTGGSGFVGARVPRHPLTLRLLALVPFPVAAPSANVFGHVSPTTARHVCDDLAARDPSLLVLDGGSSDIGIESSVVKVCGGGVVEVLRRGRVSVGDLQAALAGSFPTARVEIRDTRSAFRSGAAPMDGPGQMLTHYCPAVPASLLTPAGVPPLSPGAMSVHRGAERWPLAATVVIDFGGALGGYKERCLAYRDLSASGSAERACFDVFDALRWSETVPGATNVVFPLLSEWRHGAAAPKGGEEEELLAAVEDRLFRAASGVTATLQEE